ncbi:hypothetical protein BC936DRAFT_145645 [Jimgerdemannia flammicorona]|uniref:Uncharacterized protein n=1 Tax=Jimgerdemannia flammicorona TaxID=994334 RepID=A0A433D9I9_9FUNG|nr:hypothetical protein BC936DRAFT_145645 [Jimgerdemannia flammicorona]
MSNSSAASDRLSLLSAHLAVVAPSQLHRQQTNAAAAPTPVTTSLAGKVCIITGAGSVHGIGRASAWAFAQNGAVAIYITDFRVDHLESLAQEITAAYPGVKVIARRVDATSDEDVKGVIDDAIEKFGRLDVFFANAVWIDILLVVCVQTAGVATGAHIKDTDGQQFMESMRINGLSTFLAIKHAGAAMQITGKGGKEKTGGSIVATASVAGVRSGAGSLDYSASKAAVINMAQCGSTQYAKANIRVNAICPGLIETDMTKITFDYAKARGTAHKIGQLNPLARYGVASEVASVALFLASDASSYVNGQAWAVDGGLSASLPVAPGRFF